MRRASLASLSLLGLVTLKTGGGKDQDYDCAQHLRWPSRRRPSATSDVCWVPVKQDCSRHGQISVWLEGVAFRVGHWVRLGCRDVLQRQDSLKDGGGGDKVGQWRGGMVS